MRKDFRVVEAVPESQPELPEFTVQIVREGEIEEQQFDWPAITRDWWQMWSEHPLSKEFTASDWSFLLDTARIHAAYWSGDLKLGAELRQRVVQFGATPEARARLRITFAAANEAEKDSSQPKRSGAREKFGGLSAVG